MNACSDHMPTWIAWRQQVLELTSSDVVLHIEGHPWTGSASETTWPLAHGARICRGAPDDPAGWLALMGAQGVTVACLLPSQLASLHRHMGDQIFPPALRAVFCGGEALPCEVAERFLRNSAAALVYFHAYGTRAPVLWWRINQTDLHGERVPLGRIAEDGLTRVADAAGRPVPPGVVGNIAVRAEPNAPFEKTGDKARILRDGRVELTGSTDGHIWLRGHRVDPLDIERAILALPEVADCHVGIRMSPTLGTVAVAWVVPEAAQARRAIETRIAPALKPSLIVAVRSLPLTRTGQVDVNALESLAIPDALAQRAWQDRLALRPGVKDVAVICADVALPTRKILRAPMPLFEVQARRAMQRDRQGVAEVQESHGPALPPLAFDTLPAALRAAALAAPSRGVHFIDADGSVATLTYPALLSAARRVASGMRGLGWKAGDIVVLQLAAQDEFLIGFWACVLGGMVPVSSATPTSYVEPSAALNRLLQVWDRLGHPGVLAGSREADKLTSLTGLASPMRIAPIAVLRNTHELSDDYQAMPDDASLMLLTSGSTGAPKLVTHSHRTLLSRCASTIAHRHYSALDVSFNWMPLDHVGALVMFHLRDVVLHCDQFHTNTDRVLTDPLRWLAWMDRWRVTVTWAPNFAFALVVARAENISGQRWDLSCLRVIVNAGEAVVYKSALRFVELLQPFGLPPAAMKPEWGMSETASAITGAESLIEHRSPDGAVFVDLGRPLAGSSLRIVDSVREHPDGFAIGRLQVRGQSVMSGYFRNEDANREAFSADGWFDTGDLGFLCDGALTVVGRAKDSVIVNGLNLYSQEIEAIVEDVAGVMRSYTAACAYRIPDADTDELLVFFACEEGSAVTEVGARIRAALGRHFGLGGVHLLPVLPAEIPKTAIGKIQRSQLRAGFEAGDFDDRRRALDEGGFPDDFARVDWRCAQRNRCAGRLPPGRFALVGGATNVRHDLGRALEVAGYDVVSVEEDAVPALATVDYVVYLAVAGDKAPDVALTDTIGGLGDLVRGMSALTPGAATRLFLVSTYGMDVELPQPLDCASAALSAWLKSVAAELPQIRCRHIDLVPQVTIAELVEELSTVDREQAVALRAGRRFVPRLARLAAPATLAEHASLHRGGFWLLAGGLGGIGRRVAAHFARRPGARLLIVGRRAHDAQVQQHIDDLAHHGADLIYARCDISDMAAVQAAIDGAAARWDCALAGVVQMAATGNLAEHWESFGERGVLNADHARVRAELSAKTTGSLNLIRLLEGDDQLPFIAFSSVAATFGAATMANYAAANAFLSALCSQRRLRGAPATYCLEWSMWDQVGLAAQVPAPLRERTLAQGFSVLTPQQGLEAFLYSLACVPANVIVGVADTHPGWRSRGTVVDMLGGEGLHAYVAPVLDARTPQASAAPVQDAFGRPVPCRITARAELPRTSDGQIDTAALSMHSGTEGTSDIDRTLPNTEWEKRVAGIWSELLHIGEIDIYANFFELGGHSLLATQVISRIRSDFGVELSLRHLFETPTIAALAKVLEQVGQIHAHAPIQQTRRRHLARSILIDSDES
ncbi:SDR family NAD(P)-dependent oxidoreductase [Massilia sp. GER05]|uniref:SDR family NAD(P)-dependent oxidoreductase n=1 Tax=Massilia sp. GER05 TaxID=3394605 RepID=UPI003F8665CA